MKVLVTGSRGLVGSHVTRELKDHGHTVVSYDLVEGRDILDVATLAGSVSGCDAVVHSAALLGRSDETPQEIRAVNFLGSSHVTSAAVEAGVARVVFLSSVDALGVFKGERAPDYLPLDDRHPCRPSTPYGVSKLQAEEVFRLASENHELSAICLRLPGVWTEDTYSMIDRERRIRPEFEWDPYWEYGAFIDVRDLARACVRALTAPVDGFHAVLVSSSDITTSGRTARELATLVHPDVEWRGGVEYERDPYRSLLDIGPARELLDWSPRHTWSARHAPTGEVC